jgi:tungstate transport system substrate-binding protein
VKVIAVGTGEALALGRRRDADVLLVHSPADEEAFMADGHGDRRLPVMYNDYVILGPNADPAGVATASGAATAMQRIAATGAPFVSRGDGSGTHRRELRLWEAAGVDAAAVASRLDVGQGMGETLAIASERGAYTLADRGTYLARRAMLQTDILLDGDPELINPYSVITVRGAKHPTHANEFVDWLTGPGGAAVIRSFGVEKFGRPLFFPTGNSAGG